MAMLHKLISLAALLTAPAAALAQTTGQAEDPSQSAAWHNAQQAALAQRAAEGWYALDGGLLWRRVEGDGSGERPTVNDTVTVHYAGTFVDGRTFDSSYDRGQPATFPLAGLVPAWRLAIPQMGVGDTIEIAAPATLAYGTVGRGPIPGGATLLFTVELLDIPSR
jgi:FKBP-type peptidyl-prolyl cis-trans isomerase